MRTPPADPIADALFGKTKRDILALFYGRPDEAFYLRQAGELTGISPGTLQREIGRLVEAGILRREARGRQVYYQADPGCPVHDELRGLVTKTMGIVPVLHAALRPLAGRLAAAFVYGSVAEGRARAASDVDVMVIGAPSFAEVVDALAPAERALGREVNPTVYSLQEFRAKLAEGHHFVTSVRARPRLFLYGSDDDLA